MFSLGGRKSWCLTRVSWQKESSTLELLADNDLESLNTLTPYLIVVEELLLPWQQTTHSHDLILFPRGSHGKVTAESISCGQVCLLPQQTTHSHDLFYSPEGLTVRLRRSTSAVDKYICLLMQDTVGVWARKRATYTFWPALNNDAKMLWGEK